MLMNSGDEFEVSGGGPGAILGNYQQQGFEVEYDLEKSAWVLLGESARR
ncbi:aspartic proteinase nepenthesin-2-like, partial [Trifolium medium]|nr:aspartic proteinase nepenthesin-2-like [Trifolium medium]